MTVWACGEGERKAADAIDVGEATLDTVNRLRVARELDGAWDVDDSLRDRRSGGSRADALSEAVPGELEADGRGDPRAAIRDGGSSTDTEEALRPVQKKSSRGWTIRKRSGGENNGV